METHGTSNPFRAPKTVPYTTSKYFFPQKRVSSCEGALWKRAGRVTPLGPRKPSLFYFQVVLSRKTGFQFYRRYGNSRVELTPLGPPKAFSILFPSSFAPKNGFPVFKGRYGNSRVESGRAMTREKPYEW